MITPLEIMELRLRNQQVSGTKFKTARQLAGFMGALQAQDYAMMKWAVALRLPGSTERSVENAFNRGEILRTHLLRPTWHLAAAGDLRWMLELTAPQIRSAMKTRHRALGFTPEIVKKCNTVIEKALLKKQSLAREELVEELNKYHIPTSGDNRTAHILICAELDGLICSGPEQGGRPSYALLRNRTRETASFDRNEAVLKLIGRYFTSHGPATIGDFAWWSGLPLRDIRKGMETVADDFEKIFFESEEYWLPKKQPPIAAGSPAAYLLPAFDELVISYKNRSLLFEGDGHHKAVSSNGIFRPVIVVNGRITGLWKRIFGKDRVVIQTELFRPHSRKEKKLIEEASWKYGKFLGKETELK